MEEYREFRIIVKDRKNIEILTPDLQSPLSGTMKQDDLTLQVIKFFHKRLDKSDIEDLTAEEVEILGSFLYQLLFGAKMDDGESLRSKLKEARKSLSKSCLRLVLEFRREAAELAEFPLEYIFSPANEMEPIGYFLAQDNQLILTRFVPFMDPKMKGDGLKPSPKPLNILIVASSPKYELIDEYKKKELDQIDTQSALDTIEGLKTQFSEVIVTDKLDNPTIGKLKEALANEPHVIHFIGHGKFDEEGNPRLALVREHDENVADWVSDTRLSKILNSDTHKPPRLVFLHTCQGAQTRDYKSFRGLALRLVASGIPAVVAMQYEVENEVAKVFTEAFYQSLGEGKPIDAAVQYGRLQLKEHLGEVTGYHYRAIGSPVVYLQNWVGIIIAEAQGNDTLMCIECLKTTFPNDGRKIHLADDGRLVEWMICPACHKSKPKQGKCPYCLYTDVQSPPSTSSTNSMPAVGISRPPLYPVLVDTADSSTVRATQDTLPAVDAENPQAKTATQPLPAAYSNRPPDRHMMDGAIEPDQTSHDTAFQAIEP